MDKENPGRYRQGIIPYGPSYYATSTARDREIVQPTILHLLGWNLEHRWTADYLNLLGAESLDNPRCNLTSGNAVP